MRRASSRRHPHAPEDPVAEIRHKEGRLLRLKPHSLVGRSPLAHVRLVSRAVSFEHAVFHVLQGQWWLRDLGSRNGTFLNGKLLVGDRRAPLTGGDLIRFGDVQEEWRLESLSSEPSASASDELIETSTLLSSSSLTEMELVFGVSPNGEDVQLSLCHQGHRVSLGSRAYFYLLFYLAQARFTDRERGVSPTEEGWRSCQELVEALKVSNERVNVDIHRARQHVARFGIVDANDLIVRRKNSTTVRLGVERIRVE